MSVVHRSSLKGSSQKESKLSITTNQQISEISTPLLANTEVIANDEDLVEHDATPASN